MSRQTRCSEDVEDAVGMTHPDDSTLLAYNGQQLPAKEWSSVQQHLALCETCQQRCAELKRTTDLLTGTLAHFQRTHYYPPLAMNVLERIQNPTAARLVRQQERLREDLALGYALSRYAIGRMKAPMMHLLALLPFWLKPDQKRPRNATMNSIPAAGIPIVGFLVVLAAFVVLAYSANSNTKQHRPLGRAVTTLVQPTDRVIPQRAPTPTVKPEKKFPIQPVVTVTVMPAPGTSKLKLTLCSTGSDKAQSRIRFCGTNFIADDHVQLIEYITGGQIRRRVVSVDAQGTFQDWWVIHDCKLAPYAVLALDVTANHKSEVAALKNILFPHCVFLKPLPTVSGGRNKQ